MEELFSYYRDAGRPTLRHISDFIATNDDLAGTASKETVRRMLQGLTVPAQWETAHTVFLALCHLAGHDPDESRQTDGWGETRRSVIKDLWNSAIDELDEPSPSPATAWRDEPPF
ncbi:hypothetical protein [Saccharothrix variisporea]|uniref:hypothetical protein n=1 Tax=Saccharothrix variisporea TaxID=543527 RepID=UPI0011C47E78|nr:hypothetical protein [Saccharothrix variisporea]